MMNSWKNRLRPPGPVLDDAELIAYLDGELTPERRSEIQKMIEGSWKLRVRLAELERDIEVFMQAAACRRPEGIPPFEEVWKGAQSRESSHTFQPVEKPRPHDFVWLPRMFTARLLTPRIHWGWAGMAAFLIAAVYFLVQLDKAPAVSADKLLENSRIAEVEQVQRVKGPVIYQKLHLRRRSSRSESESLVWEVWNDLGNDRARQRVHPPQGAPVLLEQAEERSRASGASKSPAKPETAAPLVADLLRVMQANRMEWRRPLSAASYGQWRESIQPKTERVHASMLADGSKAWSLTAEVAAPLAVDSIVHAELVVRAHDWHAVLQRLQVKGEHEVHEYELAEEAYEVAALSSLPASVFTDLPPAPLAAVPQEPEMSKRPGPTSAELLASEAETFYGLHRVRACLGDPIEVIRTDGHIEARGLVQTAERQQQVMEALQGVPWLTVAIRNLAEAVKSAVPATGAERQAAPEAIQVRSSTPAVQELLERYFLGQGELTRAEKESPSPLRLEKQIADLSNDVIVAAAAAKSEAWAIRHLAERFAEASALRPAARWLLLDMLLEHVAALKQSTAKLQQLLEAPLFSQINEPASGQDALVTPSGSAAQQAAWGPASLALFNLIDQADTLVQGLFAGAELNASPEMALRTLETTLHRSQERLSSLQAAAAPEISAQPDTLSLKDNRSAKP